MTDKLLYHFIIFNCRHFGCMLRALLQKCCPQGKLNYIFLNKYLWYNLKALLDKLYIDVIFIIVCLSLSSFKAFSVNVAVTFLIFQQALSLPKNCPQGKLNGTFYCEGKNGNLICFTFFLSRHLFLLTTGKILRP